MPRKTRPRTPATTFHDWESDACRVHEDGQGNITADIYRAGRGTVKVSAGDVLWNGMQISEAEYNRLVALNDEIHGGGQKK